MIRRLAILLPVLLFLAASSPGAQVLIGSLPDIHGTPPPISSSAVFDSPTRWIRIDSAATIHGYDYPVTDCAGHEFHVTAGCIVDGSPVGWAANYETLNACGQCIEVYSWGDVVVDLGGPRQFTLEIGADNELGLGVVAFSHWQIWSYEPAAGAAGPPPFAQRPSVVPNPSTGRVEIRYTLSGRCDASLRILDPAGRTVAAFPDAQQEPGSHAFVWDRGEALPAGAYLYELTLGDDVRTGRLLLLR